MPNLFSFARSTIAFETRWRAWGGPILLPRSISGVESLADSIILPRHSPYLRSDPSVSLLEFRHIRGVEYSCGTGCVRGCDVPLVHIDADLSQSLRLRNLLREGDADRAAGERDGAPLESRVIYEGEMMGRTFEG